MLPISLTVKNFLSYREAAPTLRFEDIHVACLCGSNGNGKSALLDAITWVLWGRARGTRHDQLLHHGQDEMSVNLEFEVGGGRYRVERRYSRARRSAQSSLELSFLSSDATYHPITADTIGATEDAIKRLINMDYDTFVNSAFLIQGRADLFTMSTPTQRKEVLSKVLGLGLYDRLEERSKYYAKEAEGRLSLNISGADRLRDEVGRADEIEDSLANIATSLRQIGDRIASAGTERDRLKVESERASHAGEQAKDLAEQARRVAQRRDADISEADDLKERIGEWSVLVARSDEIEAGYGQLSLLRQRHRGQTLIAQEAAALQEQLIPLDREIIQAGAILSAEIEALRRRIDGDLTPKVDALPGIERQIGELKTLREELRKESVQTDDMRQQHQRLMVEASRLKEENKRLVDQGQETKSKLDLLSADHDPADCPLCGTVLDDTKLARIQSAFESEIVAQRQRYVDQQAQETQLAEAASQMGDNLSKSDSENKKRAKDLEALAVHLSLQSEDGNNARSQLAECRRQLELAESTKETGRFAVEAQQEASKIRTELAGLNYDAAEMHRLSDQIQGLDSWDQEIRSLRLATERLPEIQDSLSRTLGRIEESEMELERLSKRSTELGDEMKSLEGSQQKLRVSEEALSAFVVEQADLQKSFGSLSNQLTQIEIARRELEEIERTKTTAVDEVATYAELALAFGKGGIQALLIEAAIPRLEDEANALLLLMTDGRMSLKLETQRERRGSRAVGDSVIETLDIVIADEFGTRPYEMFSGGERFRIDFALRIALSKLLAWRAGASLPTLFIDEGFGTQDSVGRDRLIEVIRAIEGRFERILVITHMEDIKEAFPVRIEVSRDELGSTFAIT